MTESIKKRLLQCSLLLLFVPGVSRGENSGAYRVRVDTSALKSTQQALFLRFALLHVRPESKPTERVIVRSFDFGGGGPGPSGPKFLGGATGDLRSKPGFIELVDSDWYSEFRQQFTPGTMLMFDVVVSKNSSSHGNDTLLFHIVDGKGSAIPTVGKGDDFFSVVLNPDNDFDGTFRSDLSRTDLDVRATHVAVSTFDFNGDGQLTLADASNLIECLTGLDTISIGATCHVGDLDGKVDLRDVAMFMREFAISTFDADGDGLVTLNDAANLVYCMTGPSTPATDPSCQIGILDGKVDLRDVAMFMREFADLTP